MEKLLTSLNYIYFEKETPEMYQKMTMAFVSQQETMYRNTLTYLSVDFLFYEDSNL